MSGVDPEKAELAARSREWRRGALTTICDSVVAWESGVVARASRAPDFYEFNVVQVREDPGCDVRALTDFADEALRGLAHRRIDFEQAQHAMAFVADLERGGWRSSRLLHMRHEGQRVDDPGVDVREATYEAVQPLRLDWHQEDFPGVDPSSFHGQAHEVALARGARVLAVFDEEAPIAYAQIECAGDAAEVTEVYVRADRRGSGLGGAVTAAAIRGAPPVRDLWITADDEDRPKHLYARLGFQPVTLEMQFLRLP